LTDALKETTPAESVEEFVPVEDRSKEGGGSAIEDITQLVNIACAAINAHIDAAISKLDTYFTSLSE